MKGRGHKAEGGRATGYRKGIPSLEGMPVDSEKKADGGRVGKKCGGGLGVPMDGEAQHKRLDKVVKRSAGGRFARASGGKVELESNPDGANKIGAHVKSPMSGA